MDLPFPDSLCHRCAAPRYVQSKTSTFILCPLVPEKYPRQPVVTCPFFRPRDPSDPSATNGPPAGGGLPEDP